MKVHAFVFDLAVGGKSIGTGLKEKSSIVEVLVFIDFLAMMNFRCYVSFVFVFVFCFLFFVFFFLPFGFAFVYTMCTRLVPLFVLFNKVHLLPKEKPSSIL